MKKVCIIFLLSIIISLSALGFSPAFQTNTETRPNACESFIRIHIRADSNAEEAQNMKYIVRDGIVAYLTPRVAEYETQAEAITGVTACLAELRAVAESLLVSRGYDYGARVRLAREVFPTRVYEDFVLPSGEYLALVVELGSGQGDNWWCVVYPPLCFTAGNGNIVYRSKILQIIQSVLG